MCLAFLQKNYFNFILHSKECCLCPDTGCCMVFLGKDNHFKTLSALQPHKTLHANVPRGAFSLTIVVLNKYLKSKAQRVSFILTLKELQCKALYLNVKKLNFGLGI